MDLSGAEYSKLLLSFGVLTDVQYADRDDHPSWYCQQKWRYYRSSLSLVRKAFQTWSQSPQRVQFAMQLGDLLDGCNTTMNLNPTAALLKTLDVFAEFPDIPTYHVLGNHELYNFSRRAIKEFFGLTIAGQMTAEIENGEETTPDSAYYSFSPASGVVVVVLDCYDVAIPGYEPSHPSYKEALKVLKPFHATDDQAKWEYDDHLVGLDKRFLSYNGALGSEQLQWLEKELSLADAGNKLAIICELRSTDEQKLDHLKKMFAMKFILQPISGLSMASRQRST